MENFTLAEIVKLSMKTKSQGLWDRSWN